MSEVPESFLNKSTVNLKDPDDLDALISILKKYEHERVPAELKFLRNALTQIEFFGNLMSHLEEDIQMNLLKQIRFKAMKKQEVVFHRGDIGSHFYILLKGSVYIIKDDPNYHQSSGIRPNSNAHSSDTPVSGRHHRQSFMALLEQERPKTPRSRKIVESVSQNTKTLLKNDSPILSPEDLVKAFPGHTLLNTLHAPNYFGEIALNDSLPRTATVVCREVTYLATLNRITYNRVLSNGEYFEKKSKEKIEFFRSIPLLKGWAPQNISALLRNTQIVKFLHGQTIFHQGDEVEHIYFVKSGEIELAKDIELENFKNDRVKLESPIFDKVNFHDIEAFKDMNHNWGKKLKQKEHLRVAIVSAGEVLGDLDLARIPRVREYTAKCISESAEMFVIERQLFMINAKSIEELLYQLRYQTPKKQWRATLENKVVSKLEKKLDEYQDNLAKEHGFEPVKELNRQIQAYNQLVTEGPVEEKVSFMKELPSPSATSLQKKVVYRISIKPSTPGRKHIYDHSERKGLRIDSNLLSTETPVRKKSASESKEKKDLDISHESNFNFITSSANQPRQKSAASQRSNVRVIDAYPVGGHKIEIPPLKGVATLAQQSSPTSIETAKRYTEGARGFSSPRSGWLTGTAMRETNATWKESSMHSNISPFEKVIASQKSQTQRDLAANCEDESKYRLLQYLKIIDLVQKQPVLLHKISGSQTARATHKRTNTMPVQQQQQTAKTKGENPSKGDKKIIVKKAPLGLDMLNEAPSLSSTAMVFTKFSRFMSPKSLSSNLNVFPKN